MPCVQLLLRIAAVSSDIRSRFPAKALHAFLAFFCAFVAAPAGASEYTVSPMRMELDRDARSTVVTLTNTGKDRIEFQLKVMEWTQD